MARAAAVAGNRFNQELLHALLPETWRRRNRQGAGFAERSRVPDPRAAFGHAAYGVRHALIQETIYNATLRKSGRHCIGGCLRAVSHNRNLAAWMTTAALAEQPSVPA